MGETTVLETVKRFCSAIIKMYRKTHLRKPTDADLRLFSQENASRGFPGMLGSIDCMHWQWKNCPSAWKGAFQGKEGCPTIVLEAVCDQRLWVWHAFFGMAGSNNDLNILDRSPVFDDYLQGKSATVHYEINGKAYTQGYFLADGIYPDWPVFIKSITHPKEGRRLILLKPRKQLVKT
jgi:hypothetical protein